MNISMHGDGTSYARTIGIKLLTLTVVVSIIVVVRTTGALPQNFSFAQKKLPQKVPTVNNSESTTEAKTPIITQPSPATTAPASVAAITPKTVTSSAPNVAQQPSATTPTTTASTPVTVTPTPTPTSPYRDGTYYAIGSYVVPGSTQKIGITLVLSAGIITSTSVTNLATEPTSSNYQNDFNANYKTYVVGKKLADIVLTKVARSSLTTVGFNNAANAVKQQAS